MTRYFADAEAVLIEAARFYEDRRRGLGDDFLRAIENAVESIGRAPRRWPVVRGSIRRLLVAKYPYAILYLIYHEELVIIAIAHLSRHPTYWRSRLKATDAPPA